jgi:putative flippase GtrA
MTHQESRLRRELTRFLKFCVVGVIGAIIDFGVFNLLTQIAGIRSQIAQALSFTAAVTSNFLWNRYWTYPDSRSKRPQRQAIQFFFVSVIGLAIRTPIFILSEAPLTRLSDRIFPELQRVLPSLVSRLQRIDTATMGSNLALVLAVVVVLFWNFGANRLWTYSDAP